MSLIKEILARPVDLNIEEVIKVDQNDAEVILSEINEYVITDSIEGHFVNVLEKYRETQLKPGEGVGIWVSGFFGSGKSSFAKLLGLALSNRDILGEGAARRLARHRPASKLQVNLHAIAEKIPTDAVIFDVSTDRGIRNGNQSMTEIMHRCFLKFLGYADNIDIAQLEIDLESAGELEAFKSKYHAVFKKDWDQEKAKVAFALSQASRVMHELEPATYPVADSWAKAAHNKADVTPGLLAERAKELMKRRRPDRNLVFVVDEVGQFVARDVQKMLDLQALVQSLGRVGRGKMWLIVTSQEKLTELVGGLDNKQVELARLQDRFPVQVHLEPSDISEVTGRRILTKNAAGEKVLRAEFDKHRGRLSTHTTVSASYRLPDLTAETFFALYPLLPYQIELIIQVVSGLRTQGGAGKHVGGANRTIIKLAQQLLIHQDVALGDQPVGTLARIDQIYDLVSGNIASELRIKISGITQKVPHPYAAKVAKAICLLQFVPTFHRTAENIAACLHPAVDADSCLAEVKEALMALEKAKQVRLGDDGYRIPSPAEDDWDRIRDGSNPKPAEVNEIRREIIAKLWLPTPAHALNGTKTFKAGLFLNDQAVVEGDVPFHVSLAASDAEFDPLKKDFRTRSQKEPKSVFWAARIGERVDHHTLEYYRSKQILAAKERGARTQDELALVSDEKRRQSRHADELSRLLREALVGGAIWFRGNDRSPEDGVTLVSRAAEAVLAKALPEIFDRFGEASERVAKTDLDALLVVEKLHGLPPVFVKLGLIRDESGQPVLKTDSGLLADVFAKIENCFGYGEPATGRFLTESYAKEPYGWEFDTVRLLVACLLRAGKIDVTAQGKVIDSALSTEARSIFGNNATFRSASFRPRKTLDFALSLQAATHYEEVFGKQIADISSPAAVADAIRKACAEPEEALATIHTLLVSERLPGAEVIRQGLDQTKLIRTSGDESAILTFNGAHKPIKEAAKRAQDLTLRLTEPALESLRAARATLRSEAEVLRAEPAVEPAVVDAIRELGDLLERESFHTALPDIARHTATIRDAYRRVHAAASEARVTAYAHAIDTVRKHPAWADLRDDVRTRLISPLITCGAPAEPSRAVALIRADTDACVGRTRKVIDELMTLVEGERVTQLAITTYFATAIETQEQLDTALAALRDACEQQIAEGKKVFLR